MNSNSPGYQFADKYVVSSTFDYENTPDLIIEMIDPSDEIVGIIAPCTGPPYRTLQYLKSKMNMSNINDEVLDILLDKTKFRRFCNTIGCSEINEFSKKDVLEAEYFPLVVKPRYNGMGGFGVKIYKDINRFREDNHSLKPSTENVYEHFVNGRELAIDAIWDGHSITLVNVGWHLYHRELDIIIGSTSHNDPEIESLSKSIKQNLIVFCDSLQIGPEFLNVDMMLDMNHNLHIIEVEFVPASGIQLAKHSFGYDIVKNYIYQNIENQVQPVGERKKNVLLIFSGSFYDHNLIQFSEEANVEMIYNPTQPYARSSGSKAYHINGSYIILYDKNEELDSFIRQNLKNISTRRYNIEE